ncbi:hypothetical protein BGZ61DRAFT_368518, partial [Ilyonectria robusta]|uniref:uncharacterized protein n=1 Tax=Ilyonectria robusta TaxID=1079257 RepID=UPI001E8CECC8
VTNRDVVQLTPVTSSSSATYFNSLAPALAIIQTGLGIFALFIARFCLARLRIWMQRLRGPAGRPVPTRTDAIPPHHRYQQQAHNIRLVWAMDEKARSPATAAAQEDSSNNGDPRDEESTGGRLVIGLNWSSNNNTDITGGDSSMRRPLMSHPPPAPPLTPPELSTAVFTFEDHPRPGGDSFMRQPNPDYISSTTGSELPPSSNVSSPPMPRRRSYKKTLPIGGLVPQTSPAGAAAASDAADLTFSPSSYPPTSPLLPPAPPQAEANDINVKGEIIGVFDGEGAGWIRHTRVYGGGVCLACAALGGNHGGGFYGATVRPEEMR